MKTTNNFDELKFFAEVKKQPCLFFGKPSLISLRDQIYGMYYAFSVCNYENPFNYFDLFKDWYHNNLTDKNGYACWWNHLIYISGGNDSDAFHHFYKVFERYLKDKHNVSLPEV